MIEKDWLFFGYVLALIGLLFTHLAFGFAPVVITYLMFRLGQHVGMESIRSALKE